MSDRPRVTLVGLGASGRAIGAALLSSGAAPIVDAVEIDPALIGADLGTVLGGAPLGVTVRGAADGGEPPSADVAVVCTTTSVAELESTIEPLLRRSVDVLSLCEELAYPWREHPEVAHRIDALARQHHAAVLGTGCNPGFIMDTLPLLLSGLCQRVDRVEIERGADLTPYWTVVHQFGVGLTAAEFADAAAAGTLLGHVGFEQSAAMLADGLGWRLDGVDVGPPTVVAVADQFLVGMHVTVQPGTVAVVRQSARAHAAGRTLVEITMDFGFFAPGAELQARDICRLRAGERVLEVSSPSGYDSFASSVALAVNLVGSLSGLAPGLRTMADLRVSQLACVPAAHT